MIAALSPNGQNLCFGDEPPTRLLVATIRGVNVLERAQPARHGSIAAARSTVIIAVRS